MNRYYLFDKWEEWKLKAIIQSPKEKFCFEFETWWLMIDATQLMNLNCYWLCWLFVMWQTKNQEIQMKTQRSSNYEPNITSCNNHNHSCSNQLSHTHNWQTHTFNHQNQKQLQSKARNKPSRNKQIREESVWKLIVAWVVVIVARCVVFGSELFELCVLICFSCFMVCHRTINQHNQSSTTISLHMNFNLPTQLVLIVPIAQAINSAIVELNPMICLIWIEKACMQICMN